MLQCVPGDQLVTLLRSGLGRLLRAVGFNRLNGSQQGWQQPGRHLAMRVECLSRKVSDAFRVSAVAMGNQSDDIAITTRAACDRAREARNRERLCACCWRSEVPRLLNLQIQRLEIQDNANLEGPGQIRNNLGPAWQLNACLQGARSITVPQFAQVRRSALA
jgi:hypothetical protein